MNGGLRLLKRYAVQMEVAAPSAMWTRPDAGSAIVSYPAPTYSAAKGMFESVARLKSAFIRPTRVEICKPIQFHRYSTNYNGPLRKGAQIRGGDPFQLPAVVLADVCYRLYGVVEEASAAPGANNHLHALQEMFARRIEKGQCFRPVCLGWSEFVAQYAGPFRPETQVDKSINLTIPSMLHSVFDREVGGNVKPSFRQNVQIRSGVLEYAC
jgi:CRISPR-associated protein Cas5d